MNPESRPITSAGWATLHRIADGDTDTLARLIGYFRDPDDASGERWQFLQAAEANVWRATALLILRKLIERGFREGELDAWTRTTPLGAEIRDGVYSFFDCHAALEFASEPSCFSTLAYQELCAARLAGELHADVSDPGTDPEAILGEMAVRLEWRFPLLAQVIRHPALDLAGLTWGFMDWFIRYNFATQVALPTSRTPPPNAGLEDLAVLMLNCPTAVSELTSDVYVQAEFVRRAKMAETRNCPQDKTAPDLREDARAEVRAILSQSVPIRASTLAEAVEIAERLKAEQNVLLAINSLWRWFLALPKQERDAIGDFKNARQFWMKAIFQHRRQ